MSAVYEDVWRVSFFKTQFSNYKTTNEEVSKCDCVVCLYFIQGCAVCLSDSTLVFQTVISSGDKSLVSSH